MISRGEGNLTHPIAHEVVHTGVHEHAHAALEQRSDRVFGAERVAVRVSLEGAHDGRVLRGVGPVPVVDPERVLCERMVQVRVDVSVRVGCKTVRCLSRHWMGQATDFMIG